MEAFALGDEKYQHIVRAVFERPWAILPSTLSMIVEVIRLRAAGEFFTDEEIEARIAASPRGPRGGGRQVGRVAVLPVYGVLSPRQNLVSRSSGGTSIEGLTSDLRAALADEAIDAIVMDIDSPGGNVEGVEELAAEIRASRGRKPIVAVANHQAASAAYYLASAADEIVASPSSMVGSIGVLAAHQDLSKAAELDGVKTTLISAGKYKTEANQWEPLTDEARARIQAEVDSYYGMFVSAVAKGRGVSVDTVRSEYGQGRMFVAKEAKAAGMVDRIDTFDRTVARVAREAVAGAETTPAVGTGARVEIVPIEAIGREADAGFFVAGPIPIHHGTTDDGPFDGPATEAAIPNTEGAATFRRVFAYVDTSMDPDTKAAYSFIHHFWRGGPGPASTRGCSSGIGVCNGARGGGPGARWWGDRAGIHAHLAAHLRDAGQDVPPLALFDDPTPTASVAGLSFADRLDAVADEVEAVLADVRKRAAIRADEGRVLSEATRERLARLRQDMDALTEEAERRPRAAGPRNVRRLLELEAAIHHYPIPS